MMDVPFFLIWMSHLVADVHQTCSVIKYFPATVGVNRSVERSKLLLVSKVSVDQVTSVSTFIVAD